MKLKQAIIFIIVGLIGGFFWIKCSIIEADEQWKFNTPLFQNNIIIRGTVDSLSDSGNHCFGIIYMRKFEANIHNFNPQRKRFFPYSIHDDQCEIYSNLCLHGLQKGDSIFLNSNKRNIKVIARDKNYSGEYNLDFVDSEVGYIRNNSKFVYK